MKYKIYQIDAFTNEAFGGNPAGVVPEAKGLNERDMQNIASEMNLSETAFIEKLNEDYYNVRFFTPTEEVNLCGHATIGSFYLLAKKYIKPIEKGVKTITQNTKAGELKLFLEYENNEINYLTMEMAKGESFGKIEDLTEIAGALNISVEDIKGPVDTEIISTGLKDILMPVKDLQTLKNIIVDNEKLTQISNKLDVGGLHAYFYNEGTVYARNFAPALGINEEAATGTSNGALIYLLDREDIISEIIVKQGMYMNRPSEIIAKVEEGIVLVGGRGKIVIEGEIYVS